MSAPRRRSGIALDDIRVEVALHEIQHKKDPFEGLSCTQIKGVLERRGFLGVIEGGSSGLQIDLDVTHKRLVLVVTDGAGGDRNLEKLEGAHGTLPLGPRWPCGKAKGRRWMRLYRAPVALADAPNLHGVVPGVHLITTGVHDLPSAAFFPWPSSYHPAHYEVPELPRWLVDAAKDPATTRAAWSSVTREPGSVRVLAEWEQELTMHRGRPAATFANACTILRKSPTYSGRLVFDELVQGPTFEGRAIGDGTVGQIREGIERAMGACFGGEILRSAIQTVAEERRVHPVRDYLTSLRWDQHERIDGVADEILGAKGSLPALMVRRFLVGAVARVMKPGCKLDTALVLVGPQGARKSTFYQTLGGAWFTDTHVDLGSKDAYLQLAGAWIVEWGEIERVTSRRGADEIKSFLSSRVDRFRPPYGRSLVEVPRTCVLVGSTNQTTFLDDETGSRRFHCVRVPGRVNLELLTPWRDQVWAEAVALFERGDPWWLESGDDTAREEDAEQHAVEDPWTGPVLRWVTKQDAREEFQAEEVLSGALDVPKKDQDRRGCARVGRILRAAGWERRKHRPYRDGRKQEPAWCWFRPTTSQATLPVTEGEDAPFP